MSKPGTGPAVLAALCIAWVSGGHAQSPDLASDLEDCAGIAAREARLACFDKLSSRASDEEPGDAESSSQEAAETAPAAPATTATVPPAKPDKSDSADVPARAKKRQPDAVEYAGMITACKKGHYGNWYFFMDNGQVWKDTNRRQLRLKDCHLKATITKDRIGYEMQIEGIERPVRVRLND